MNRYPLYRASGTPRELGRQHGRQASVQIRAHVAMLQAAHGGSLETLHRRALRFVPLFERHCPHLLEELQGLAEGAGVDFGAALATNIRGALAQAGDDSITANPPAANPPAAKPPAAKPPARDEGCTSFVVAPRGAASGEVLIGQNSDMLPAYIELSYVLHLKPQGKPEILMWTFGGMIGYHGINSRGIGHGANDLGGGPPPRFALPHYPLKRLLLECASLREARELFERTPLAVNGNYVLCDGDGEILDVEATSEGPQWVTDRGAGFIAHTNHFLDPLHATEDNYRRSAADSFTRLERMNALIAARFGNLAPGDFRRFLRDCDGAPSGICRAARTTDPAADWVSAGVTVASLIAEPAQRRIQVAAGNSPDAEFVVYAMDDGNEAGVT